MNLLVIINLHRMTKATFILLALILAVTCTVIPRTQPLDCAHPPLVWKVQIDDDPKTRWAPIIPHYQKHLVKFLELLDLIPFPKTFFDGLEEFSKTYKHQDFVAEIRAIAELACLPFDKIFFANFLYEFTKFKACTGIIARSPEGEIFHARNMDFEFWEIFGKLAAKVQYMRGDETIFTADYYIGSAFVHTGMRHGGFSIEANARNTGELPEVLINLLKNNYIPTTWLIRRVLAEETNYANAVARLKRENVSATIYFIVAGVEKNEGIVIEKEMDHVVGTEELTDDKWFIVQTNYDRNQTEPLIDVRRAPAEKKMKARGDANLKMEDVHKIITEWPNFNIATIITASMIPKKSYHNTTVWYGENPPMQQTEILTQEQ